MTEWSPVRWIIDYEFGRFYNRLEKDIKPCKL